MKQFSRLRDEEGTEVERLLLGSATGDAPKPGTRAAALAALGLAGAAAGTAGTAHAASAALVGSTGGKTAGSAAGFTLAKWLLVGAVAGATTTSGLVVATTPGVFGRDTGAEALAPARPASPRATAVVTPPKAQALAEDGERAEPRAEQESHSPASPSTPRTRTYSDDEPGTDRAPAPQGTAFPIASADTVAEEVAALDKARAALAAGDGSTALARLDAYERRYPRGTLAPEAAVLRVRALVKLGRSREARSAVEAFVRAHPGSPQASRLRSLVGD
jgi:hypothetical protein